MMCVDTPDTEVSLEETEYPLVSGQVCEPKNKTASVELSELDQKMVAQGVPLDLILRFKEEAESNNI